VVDWCGQLVEEPLEPVEIGGVEGCGVLRAEFQRRLVEPVGIAAGEDDTGTLSPGPSSFSNPDAGVAADHDDGLSDQLRFALGKQEWLRWS
jgi:hypothetical protein